MFQIFSHGGLYLGLIIYTLVGAKVPELLLSTISDDILNYSNLVLFINSNVAKVS